MGEIEWAMWANEQAIAGAFIMFIGGIVGVAGSFKNWEFAAAAIPMSLLILFVEWPRSKRSKGNTIERRFQKYISPVINALGPVTRNYFVRFIVHIVFSVPCCFLLPTIMGGMCLMISGIIYLVAALKGEEWKPVIKEKREPGTTVTAAAASQPPKKPPPRVPGKRAGVDNQELTVY